MRRLVTLVSGGLDSTLMAFLAREEGIDQFPLFIDYGQLCAAQEWATCREVFSRLSLPEPTYLDVSGFGRLISSGLTDATKSINEDAFLPGRNLLFLLIGSSYAYQTNSSGVAIGLLSEESSIFPDQKKTFLSSAEGTIETTLGREVSLVAPLMGLTKRQVIDLARMKHLTGTYSCHAGDPTPCGQCVSCREFQNAEDERSV